MWFLKYGEPERGHFRLWSVSLRVFHSIILYLAGIGLIAAKKICVENCACYNFFNLSQMKIWDECSFFENLSLFVPF